MKLVLVALPILGFLTACASTHPRAGSPEKSWVASCKELGCIDAGAGTAPPAGSELRVTECRDGRTFDYRYKMTDAGWKLVMYGTERSLECAGAGDS